MRKSIVALALMAAAAVPATAQTPPPQPPRADARPDREAMRKARADDIALLIGLRTDQRAGLDVVLERPMGPGGPGGPDRGPMRGAPGGPPPSFAQRLAEMETRDNAARQRVTAIKAFYQGLDTQQRARFEAVMRLDHRPGFGPGGFGRPPMMGMGMRHGPMPGGPDGPDGPDGPGGTD